MRGLAPMTICENFKNSSNVTVTEFGGEFWLSSVAATLLL